MCDAVRSGAPDTERLLREYARTRDPALREDIVKRYLGTAAMIASRFSGRGVEYDDLYQVASLALLHAMDRFDPGRGMKFVTFAVPTMVGEVKNYFRDRSRAVRLPRGPAETLRRLEAAVDQLTQEKLRQPTPEELAERLGVGLEDVLEALELRGASSAVSLDGMFESGENETPLEAFLGMEESGYSSFEMSDALSRAMNGLDERDRELIRLRFFDGLSQRETARRLGISQMSVSRAERRALAGMRANMAGVEE